jgi:Protein of unknown function (DUF4035)
MPASEWAEWRIFMRLEPIGETRSDIRHAIAIDVLAQVNGNKPRDLKDYMPQSHWPDQKEIE